MYIYETIANDIIEGILDHNIQPGDRLPSELELIKKYQTSKMTVRRAYQILKDMDVAVSKQGSGIFIKDHRQNKMSNNQYLAGYTLLAILKGFNPQVSNLEIKHRFANLNLANILAIDVNDSILQVERTRTIHNRRVSFEVAYIPKDRLNNYTDTELKESIHRFMANHADDNLVSSSRFYSAVIPQEYLLSKLDLDDHEAVFVIEQVSKDSEDKPLLYTKSFQSGKMINI
ncbi:MAG: GntR family transcriptional regulator [Mycoplasmatales bacterium]